jgi:predicted RNA-binding Zn-ribbon protein involved in translation (DUF1610 family)
MSEGLKYDTVPWVVIADLDKPHRCPACWAGAAVYDAKWRTMRWGHAYTCPRCGQRYGKGFWRRNRAGKHQVFSWLRYIWWWRKKRYIPDLVYDVQALGFRRALRSRRYMWFTGKKMKWGWCVKRNCWHRVPAKEILCIMHRE